MRNVEASGPSECPLERTARSRYNDMSDKIVRRMTCLAALAMWGIALSSSSFGQDESPPAYRVANLLRLEPADGQYFAMQWSNEIAKLQARHVESPHKELGTCCEVSPKPPKPTHREEVYASIDVLPDNRKHVRVFVDEHWPEETDTGELKVQGLTCGSSTSYVECYQSLLKRMAKAVQEHDEACHRERKCTLSDGVFKNQSDGASLDH